MDRKNLLFLLFALPLACGDNVDPQISCDPVCPAGTLCTPMGCVSEGGSMDMASETRDLAGACTPACFGATPHCNAMGACVPCLEDGHCPAGQVCKSLGPTSTCVPGCVDDARCGGGSGKCCAGQCLDTAKDAQNCGACGMACSAQNARAGCVDGQCVLGACNPGWGDCNRDPGDGCEANLNADPKNCQTCGTVCALANANAGCADGCYLSACNFGFDDCNGNEKDGCELNVLNNNSNCGACGNSCPNPPHARNNCINAACQITACDAGYSDCDGLPANGCEIAVASDANHCGVCGMKCGQGLVCKQSVCTCPQCILPNAKSACVNLQCAVAQCNVNYGDCDGQPQNGCELNLTANAQNCGACGKACDQGLICLNGSCTCPNCMRPNARTVCVNKVCMLDACFQGYGNCDGDELNGCETDFSVDSKHCGACGKACPMGNTCVNGVCEAFRANVMLCGASGRSISVFVPMGMNFMVVNNNCNPDINTQALFLSRNWANGISAQKLQEYLNNGGIVFTEYNMSHLAWNAAFGTNAAMGARAGSCQDTLPSVVQFTPNDPFWQANQFQMQQLAQTGCGYSVSLFPGIIPLSGWDQNNVAVGYRDLGSGRFWATDFDWSDNEVFPYEYTQKLMQYMVLHRR